MKPTVQSPFPGSIIYHKVTTSTMDLARSAVLEPPEGGLRNGAVFWAGHQTGGRGRVEGRRWSSRPGESLLFTILIAGDALGCPVSAFPLIMGLAAALTLEDLGLRPEIKWPNDIILSHRKAAGILCETRGPWLCAGMGFNLGRSAVPPELAGKGVSLDEFLSGAPLPGELLERFLHRLHKSLALENWREMVEQRLYRRGAVITVVPGLPGSDLTERSGRVMGVGSRGELLLHNCEDGAFSVFSGEVLTWEGYS